MQTPAVNEASQPRLLTLKDVKANPKTKALIDGANEVMRAMGFTEHGHRHAGVVSSITRYIMENLSAPARETELAQIAAYLHDVGNVINRVDHPMTGANLAYSLLNEMGMDTIEIAPILGAIGNHEELAGTPVSLMSAALIVADKSDVHYSRVQNPIIETFDIHDRVNYAVQKSRVNLDAAKQTIELTLEIDTSFASVMEYFEIFLSRMVMCRRAADTFGYKFTLSINGTFLE
ncbi:MAG TPA: HD domain-containing protein [Fimbriimonadaceae bacterium]|nr:HD domain-containing protein [Fimbriimonadaceae bacterium]HRJ97437.1 HD domain-containing protein [Fimbriimonadaceae bacterium]